MKNKSGFTLAEVLITLGIIGVVAALTIPPLIENNQKIQYAVALKKAYTSWNQAMIRMAADAGTPGDFSTFFTGNEVTIGDELVKYFNVAKNCAESLSGCFPDKVIANFEGTGAAASGYDALTYYRFMTADGASYSLSFNPQYSGCHTSYGAAGTAVFRTCSLMTIDVNGLKKPNAVGRDIFYFFITSGTGNGPILYPRGGNDYMYWQTNGCNYGYGAGADKTGWSCAGRIMEDSWEMNY